MCNRASDYAENVSPGPAENDDVEDDSPKVEETLAEATKRLVLPGMAA